MKGAPSHRLGILALARWLFPGVTRARVGWSAALTCAVALAWMSPWSPGALHWADLAMGLGRPEVAAAHYDRAARWSPFRGVRTRALARGAMIAAVELGDSVRARRQLERLARTVAAPAEQAEVKERIASLLLDERQPLEAARLLREAHDTCRACPEAPRRLLRAADLLSDFDVEDQALALYAQVLGRHPAQRSRANLGRAEILLARGETLEALHLFEDAASHTFDPDLAAVARLGATTCLERLGNLDEALAQLDAADLPPQVHASRREGLRARLP